ncbi:hypothetical protein S7711_02909 [Stachybotrys chartarum IBT 7711]|uniref:Uncharacterized protein n=1 Tax=Stachybotrys chartarum (strain CBS 109288 / IBT 7711) TaxID=1280523 RepID=A0A084B295_STACB|nr:hypothetical protein S7711_02909 [Stachybotrys chartarum IBT 7711]KFA56315.1 hypothetical protein S40293_08271 [Stachybotrys chartarum IBT 40293]KFA81962.1 hypothetical protein S40288_04372 [Stachybotrys chartarum IBT 40288]
MATANPHQTPLLDRDAADSIRHEPRSSTMQCCCGRIDCAVLRKNSSTLEMVEKDVHTAAQLGQALLARHEAFMADAERDRLDLTSRIERLEMDKKELEAENASKIEENRNLLDQLEMLNNNVSESDFKIKSLEASLLSCQQAVRRLEHAAARAEDAERHLALLEEEQDQLFSELRTTREDARSHAQRCKEAQRGILDMQDQLERIEKEAREERERHVQVIGRMERQREVEKQLDTAAGRLKGAAATKSLQNPKNGSSIVGHFVRDLLEDNANLQLGIAELRELLMNSNDEIQSLREQLMYHQPMPDQGTMDPNLTLKAELRGELDPPETRRFSQELHIHHHYHPTPKGDAKKHKKKRHSLGPVTFTPPSLPSPATPRSSPWRLAPAPATAAVLSNIARDTAPTISTPPPPNWAPFSTPPSEFASLPSSPRSNKRNSMFDLGQTDCEQPASPVTSFDPMSPTWRASHSKRPSAASTRSFQALPMLDAMVGSPPNSHMQYRNFTDNTIHEVEEDGHHVEDTPGLLEHNTSTEDSTTEDSEFSKDDLMPRPRLHRALSHESIMSLSGGLDIHTLKARPSQMTLRPLGGAEAIVTGVTAQPTLSRTTTKRSSVALRDHFSNLQTPRAVSGPQGTRATSPSPQWQASRWVAWRPWGGSPGTSSPATTATTTTSRPADKDKDKDWKRAPGINQPGAIPGFQQYWAAQKRKGAPARVTACVIDQDALREGLGE